MTNITNLSLKFNEANTVPASESIATDGTKISYLAKEDSKILILFKNGSSANSVTVEAGDGIQGVSDLKITLGANETKAITLESGYYVKSDGYIIVTAESSGVSANVIELP